MIIGLWQRFLSRLAVRPAGLLARKGSRRRRQASISLRPEMLELRVLLTPNVLSINLAVPAAATTNAASVSYTVTFDQNVNGVDPTDFAVARTGTVGETLTQVTPVSGSVYTVTISGITGSGTLGLNLVDNDSINQNNNGQPLGGPGAGNGNFTGQQYTIDPTSLNVSPHVVSIDRTFPSTATTSATSVSYTVTFSAAVTGVDPSDFTLARTGTIGATLTQVTPVSASVYKVTISGITGSGTLGLNLADNGSIRNLAGSPLVQANASAMFQSPATFAAAAGPEGVVSADVNGDGKPDLITGNHAAGNAHVLLGNGDGTFQAQIAFAADNPTGVTAADVNGDGKIDLLVPNKGGAVDVLLGNGDGTFQNQVTYAAGSNTRFVAVADVNRDGKPDLLVANASLTLGGGTVSVLLGNGDGTFQGQTTYATSTSVVAVADLNGDGKPDLVAPGNGYDRVCVRLGNGDGTFQSQTTFAAGSGPNAVAIRDVNGDGKPDLLVADTGSNTVGVLLGNGDGTFQTQTTFAVGGSPISVQLADANGDGKADLLVANTTDNSASVLLANGDGTFQSQTTFALAARPSFPGSLAVGDVNGDGRPDLLAASYNSGSVSVLLGSGNGNFTGQVYTIDPAAAPPALNVSPHVVSINRTTPSSTTTNATSVSYTVTFSEAVTGVDSTDFTLARGGTVGATLVQVAPVSGSGGAAYTVTVGGITGSGTLGLNLLDNNSIRDADGNPLVQTNASAAFQGQATFATGSFPISVAMADVNGDGRPDLLVGNGANANVSVLIGNGNGTFQAQATFAAGTNPNSVAVADVNGDGRPDLLVANVGSNNVSVLLGNGNGTFQTQSTFAVGVFPLAVAVADVNGDGQPDLLVANQGSNDDSVSVLLGNGNGTFQAQATFGAGSNPFSVAVGDVNGDGRLDLLVANSLSDNVSVLLGNGNGTFQAQATFATGVYPVSVAVGDVNGDGRPDLLVANLNSKDVSVLLGNGNGTFQAQATFATGTNPHAVAVGDVNGDGRPDLLVANLNDKDVSVLLGNGNGTFQAQTTFAGGSSPVSVAVGDVNGDGRTDLVVANNGSSTVSLLLGSGNGNFTGQAYTINPAAAPPALNVSPQVVSINRTTPSSMTTSATSVSYTVTFSEAVTGVDPTDFAVVLGGTVGTTLTQVTPVVGSGGTAYTVTISGITGSGTLGLNLADDNSIRDADGNPLVQTNAAATFQAQATFGTGNTPRFVTVGDVNGDGRPDLLVANYNSGSVSVLLGNGGGTFQAQTTFPTGTKPISAAVSDVNGDGRPDLIIANVSSNNVSVLLGNGDGTFQAQTTFAADDTPLSAAVADVNGDGRPDLIVANLNSSDVSVLMGNGNGTFQAQATFAAGSGPTSAAVRDVNGDGRPDLIIANYNGNNVSVLLGNGNGTFQAQVTFATGSRPFAAAVGDVNGDGRPDLFVANEQGSNVSVLLGNGNGTFQAQATFGAGNNPGSLAVGDVNGDGRADLLVTNGGDNNVSVLLGNGNGTFQAQATFAAGSGPRSVSVGDVNGDGRQDLIIANNGSNNVSVLLGSGNGNFTGQQYTINPAAAPPALNVSPQVVSINRTTPASTTTNATSVSYTVTFSEAVTGVDLTDFILATTGTVGATLIQATPVGGSGGTAYTVTVSGITGSGTLGLNLVDDNSIRDANGNPLVRPNATAAFQAQATFAAGNDPLLAVAVDLNGDGRPDLISANAGSSNVSVLMGNGNGTFQAQATFAAGNDPISVAVADVNADGRPDVLVANDLGNNVSVMLGNGDGTFQAQATFAAGSRAISVAVADVNGDGRPDLLVSNSNSYTVSVLLGNGNGTFQAQTTFAAGKNPHSVTVVDVNGDGRPDLLVANTGDNTVSVLLGNGNGTFQAQTTLTVGSAPLSVAVKDLNGDGRPDLVVANRSSNNLSVLLGNGDGSFQSQTTFGAGTFPYSVAVVDVNGDGRPDLLVANYSSHNASVLLGNGNGTFQAQATFAASSVPVSMAAGDVNGDGRPDLIVANQVGNTVSVLLGAGNGNFTGQAYTIVPPTTPIITVTAASPTVVNLSWTASPGATSYFVDYNDGSMLQNSTIHPVGPNNGVFGASQTSVQITGMTAGGVEQFFVYAINGTTNPGSGWVPLTMPTLTAPTITARAASPTMVNLSWTASPGATSYFVDYNDGSMIQGSTIHPVGPNNGVFSATQTSVQVTGMTAGGVEQFFVYAIAGSANAGSGWVPLTMPPLLTAPVITATAASPTVANLSWTAPPGATSYYVDYNDGSLIQGSAIHPVGPNNGVFSGSQTTVQVTGMTAGGVEQFFVYAINGSANTGSGWVPLTMPTQPKPQLAAPIITVTAASPTAANLTWTASPGATSYFVDYNDGSLIQGSTIHPVGPNNGVFSASQTSVQVTGMTPGGVEQFFVYAINGSTNPGSGWVGLTMPPLLTAPVITATAASPTVVNLSWTASPGATGYFVDYNDGSLIQGSTIHPVGPNNGMFGASQTSFQVTGMTAGSVEQFFVYAINGSANAGSGWKSLAMPPLAAPTITATAASTTVANLSWTASPGATGYYVSWYDSSVHNVGLFSALQTTIQVTGLTPGASLKFFVYAISGSANAESIVTLTMPAS